MNLVNREFLDIPGIRKTEVSELNKVGVPPTMSLMLVFEYPLLQGRDSTKVEEFVRVVKKILQSKHFSYIIMSPCFIEFSYFDKERNCRIDSNGLKIDFSEKDLDKQDLSVSLQENIYKKEGLCFYYKINCSQEEFEEDFKREFKEEFDIVKNW